MAVKPAILFLGTLVEGRHEVYTCPDNKVAGFSILHAKGKAMAAFSLMVSVERGVDEIELLPDGIDCKPGQTTRDFNQKQILDVGSKLIVTLGAGADAQVYLGGFEQDV